jgi:hypothetical protein
MKFHVHLTVSKIDTIPIGWKETVILLEKDSKQQLDIMLTKHYKFGYRNINSLEDIKSDISNLNLSNLIRVKIEQDEGFYLPITKDNYVEVHVLCPEETLIDSTWVKSKNPKKQIEDKKYYFLNKRIYSGENVDMVKQSILQELSGINYSDIKLEQIVFDSNFIHDSWWS